MPSLDSGDLEMMERYISSCGKCKQWIEKNYCRECDEFFNVGHDPACTLSDTTHQNHRTY